MAKRKQPTYRGEAVCHGCGEPISYDTSVKSMYWAYGMPGVRWAMCSADCARKHDERPEHGDSGDT